MRVIVAGSRGITDAGAVAAAIEGSGFEICEVVSGMAHGVDRLGEAWAETRDIPIKHFPADWKGFGRRAGYRRNEAMGIYADALVAVWDGSSKGTAHMIEFARERGLKVFVWQISLG